MKALGSSSKHATTRSFWTAFGGLPCWLGIVAFLGYLLFLTTRHAPAVLGHDTDHFYHWVSAALEYGSGPFDLSIMSPFQGLGGGVQPLGVRLNPVYAITLIWKELDARLLGNIMGMLILASATFAFGGGLGLPMGRRLLAAQMVAIFSLPPIWSWSVPFTKLNGFLLYGLVPGCVIPAALGTILLATFLYLGRLSTKGNAACIILMPILVVYSILCDPLYTAMFFVTIGFLMFFILIGSTCRTEKLWRLAGGGVCLLVLLSFHFLGFLKALFQYAARARFPNELYVEVQQWDGCTSALFQGGIASVAVVTAMIACAFTLFWGPKFCRGISGGMLAFFGAMIAACLYYVYGGNRWSLPLPTYMELPALPGAFVLIFVGVSAALERTEKVFPLLGRWLQLTNTQFVRGLVLCLVPVFGIYGTLSSERVQTNPHPGDTKGLVEPLKSETHPAHFSENESVVDFLRQEISIRSDQRFRGSVANLLGIPGGPLMDRLGIPQEAPCDKQQLMFLDSYCRSFDPSLPMSDLWNMRIPTLEDNNHLVTPPFHFLMSRLLSRTWDYHSRNWAVLSDLRPRLMAALGVRFVISDRRLETASLALRHTQTNRDGVKAYLYELQRPNLGQYSPTQGIVAAKAPQMVDILKNESFDFEKQAVVETALPEGLVPASESVLSYEKGGARVRASSSARSMLVLPLQFSNSLKISGSTSANSVELVRVNLLETGLIFSGTIDVQLSHVFGPFRGIAGRLKDVEDCQRLAIAEDGSVPYPPDYQPLSRNGWKFDRGLNPKGDTESQVEEFLQEGGAHWKSERELGLKEDSIAFSVWPVTDRQITNDSRSAFAPFEIHWRLKSVQREEQAKLDKVVCVCEWGGKVSPLRPLSAQGRRDGILNFAVNAQAQSVKGKLRIYLMKADASPQRVSNVVEVSMHLLESSETPVASGK